MRVNTLKSMRRHKLIPQKVEAINHSHGRGIGLNEGKRKPYPRRGYRGQAYISEPTPKGSCHKPFPWKG